ncbi:Transcriptional regulator, AraC family [Alloactinosynnema sp. L-07]|uniref:helix-turn-helix domain-containing protein n=1 Tax=Alloactinosynnema sp. L-07 TaxID=1653480 RepID=UPI00065EEF72|nr:helix-turn-helix domain-containing protein [Alloactinosynnema sp. L-07]CRK56290.1 Transcriptional regulator, AraC family [Alloactinosynnema sp. L-07]
MRAAAEAIVRDPSMPGGADGLAAAVGVSTSRFLHLFRDYTGTSFRRYRLWARMLAAGSAIAAGGNLTDAAADAGFASPSHLSSSFHAMFGLRPSLLLATGARVVPLSAVGAGD